MRSFIVLLSLPVLAAACTGGDGGRGEARTTASAPSRIAGDTYVVRDTLVASALEISGVAAAKQQATLSTKLMATVTDVLVKEGDRVDAGQPLVKLDARDLAAKSAQSAAAIADADAMRRDAQTQATRIRALYADSAATRAQLDAVEIAVARAEAGLRAAHAGADELAAVIEYSVVRSPFAGIVTKRFVDPGAFAAPGAPLVAVDDDSQLRITANTTPDVARALHRGASLDAAIEGRNASATIEGVVPATAGNLYSINALVPNGTREFLAGSSATLFVPQSTHRAILIPQSALVREGDLVGVIVRSAAADERRWIRIARQTKGLVEVTAGLHAGDTLVVPSHAASVAARN